MYFFSAVSYKYGGVVMANDARDLTTLWRDIEEVTDALEAAIAQLVRSAQPHPKLVEALIIGEV